MGARPPPHAYDLYRCHPWGLSVPIPFPFIALLFIFCLRIHFALSGLVALFCVFSPSAEGVYGFFSLLPPSLLLLST